MKNVRQGRLVLGLALVVVCVFVLLASTRQTVRAVSADDAKSAGGPHYTVVITEAHNLLVTDNATNTLYFYTTDKDKPIGSPLKLRASVDLAKVGAEEIRITTHNLEGAGK